MQCPTCAKNLKPVSVPSKYGQTMVVDQCETCGGIWFDEWELFPIDASSITKIDKLDEKKLTTKTPPQAGLNKCPKCDVQLQLLKDPLIPKKIEMLRCSKCNGFWMNRGEASEYKNYQQRRNQDSQDSKIKQDGNNDIKEILKLHGESQDTLRMVGKTLSTNVDPYGIKPFGQSPEEKRVMNIIGVARIILEILFRLLMRG